ncbi:MAG: ferric uptake regulator, Fur family [Marmoricola sp.]|nr:ferric uptake regulator, Fur family [Marmoricola sp.]
MKTVRSDPGADRPRLSAPAGRVRNTRQAVAIEAVLADADGFRTAQELFDALRERGEQTGLTTVYRHLGLLAEQGRVDVVKASDTEARYRLCGVGHEPDEAGVHHHHVVCRVCGRSVEVSGPEVEAWADRVASEAGFTEVTHTLEVFGLCPEHSAPASRGQRSS